MTIETIEGAVDAIAYTQGIFAHDNHLSENLNPYEEKTFQRQSWEVGFRGVPLKGNSRAAR